MDIELARKALIKQLHGRCEGVSRDLQIKGPVYSGYNSRIYKVMSSDLPFDAALKFCLQSRTSTPDVPGAQQQFSTLESVANVMPSGHYCIPCPYLLLSSDAAYMTEWISGPSVSGRLFSPGVQLDELTNLIEECAKWLRHFHQGGLQGSGSLDVEHKLFVLSEIAQARDRTSNFYDEAMEWLVQSAGLVAHSQLQRSWVHGDFKSDNLIVNGDRMVGVDIHAQTVNYVVYDIAAFLNHIDLNIHRWRHKTIRKNRHYLYGRFLAAYAPETSNELVAPVLWARVYKLLMGWSRLRQSNHGLARRTVLEHQFKQSMKSALQELK